MSEDSGSNNSGGGCGCISFIATIMILWALVAALPTPWGTLELDLFPPAIRLYTPSQVMTPTPTPTPTLKEAP